MLTVRYSDIQASARAHWASGPRAPLAVCGCLLGTELLTTTTCNVLHNKAKGKQTKKFKDLHRLQVLKQKLCVINLLNSMLFLTKTSLNITNYFLMPPIGKPIVRGQLVVMGI